MMMRKLSLGSGSDNHHRDHNDAYDGGGYYDDYDDAYDEQTIS